MKKLIINISIIIMLCIKLSGQYLYEYDPTSLATPKGITVNALVFDEENYDDFDANWIAYWDDYWIDDWDAELIEHSTKYYNCHGYAWHNIEGHMSQGQLRWINDVNEYGQPIYNVTKYYSGSQKSYTQTTTYIENLKVSYFPRDHSAITTENTNYYISKWAWGPLVEHNKAQCPFYENAQIKYYKIYPQISGSSSILCSGSPRSFISDINNMPLAAKSWSKSSNLSKIYQGDFVYVTIPIPGASGNAWIKMNIVLIAFGIQSLHFHSGTGSAECLEAVDLYHKQNKKN